MSFDSFYRINNKEKTHIKRTDIKTDSTKYQVRPDNLRQNLSNH